jgi:hypothetical protein
MRMCVCVLPVCVVSGGADESVVVEGGVDAHVEGGADESVVVEGGADAHVCVCAACVCSIGVVAVIVTVCEGGADGRGRGMVRAWGLLPATRLVTAAGCPDRLT